MKLSHPPSTNFLKHFSPQLSLYFYQSMASEEEDGRTQDKSYYVTDDYLNRFHHWTVATSKLRKDELRTLVDGFPKEVRKRLVNSKTRMDAS
jgi:hypothetical protein